MIRPQAGLLALALALAGCNLPPPTWTRTFHHLMVSLLTRRNPMNKFFSSAAVFIFTAQAYAAEPVVIKYATTMRIQSFPNILNVSNNAKLPICIVYNKNESSGEIILADLTSCMRSCANGYNRCVQKGGRDCTSDASACRTNCDRRNPG